ncbi:ABC transporter substrate-binding protein [Cohnella mopanensis]|uniref:ABC transporter substrate-binding protein n=1 Tax=Cohnella mopanensis TaxID=2911966 RepID=UPI001EF7EA0B
MKNSIKVVALAFLSFTLLAGIIGCSNSDNNEQEKGSTDQQVTLKFVWWGSEGRKESTLKVIELYKKDNPHVNFETEVLANTGEMATQLAIQTANQSTADIIQADYNFIFNYINRDLIEPLDPFVKDGIISLADIDKSYLTPGMKDDQLYALTIGNNSTTFIYDSQLFAKAGVPVPNEGYTIDELYQTLRLLKQNIDSPDFYPLGNMIDVFYYMRARGASMYNKDATALGYQDDQLMADYFALNKKWRDEGLLGNSSAKVSNDESHPIVSGKTALFSVSSNSINTLSKISGQSLRLLPYPKITKEHEGNFIKPSMFLAMSSYSNHKEEAAKFIDFFLNNEDANDILNGERGVPVSSKIATRLSAKLDETGKEQYRFLDYLTANSKPIDPPYPSNHVVISKAYDMALKQVTDGNLTPVQAAQQYRNQAKEYLVGEGEGSGE